MHGEGTCRFAASNDVYEGQFSQNRMHGRGVERYASGDVYDGEWHFGRMQGHGTYRYADGEVEVGRYHEDVDVGDGVRWSADGRTARRMRDGEVLEEVTLAEARAIAERLGEKPPA